MCLTAHWVDETFVLRKKIINFCQISNHKGVTIRKAVYRCLQEWGIDQDWGIDRVFTITVDNASSNDGAVKYLKTMFKGSHSILDCKYLHLRCCAHIINLVGRDGLDEQMKSITKIRNAVKFLRSSPSRYESFKKSVAFLIIKFKRKPCLDVETRWNSTFLMLETAEKYSDAFDRLQEIDFDYKGYFQNDVEEEEGRTRKRIKKERVLGAPQEEDWENARYFIEFLEIFFNVTKKISGSNYVTSNLSFGELVKMHSNISKMCQNTDEKKKKMALSMKEKYEKYWYNLDNMNFLLHVALVLDPRNKLHYLKYCLGLIYGVETPKCLEVLGKVESTLSDLYKHFKMKLVSSNDQNTTVFSSSTSSGSVVDLDDGFQQYLEDNVDDDGTELDIYTREKKEKKIKGDDTFDVLNWWKLNSKRFPILSQVAKYVLGMSISTVASESAFSTGGRVIDKFRSSLTPQTAEALICTQDWTRSKPADLQDMRVNGLPLQELVENLEKLEIDILSKGKAPCNTVDEDWD